MGRIDALRRRRLNVAIDCSGKWWVGSEAADIEAYLRAYEAEGHLVDETRLCKCKCGSIEFRLEADRNEGCAQRLCAGCGTKHLICDSAKYWNDAEPENWFCVVCQGVIGNVAVGFSLYEADEEEERDVRWISVGVRCVGCGTLSSPVDWKVGYGSSYQLLEEV
jgi:hypothetical protein